MIVALIALASPVVFVVVEAGGRTIPGGTILDIGECRSRFCPRNALGSSSSTTTTLTTHPRPRPLTRTVEELFGFGGQNYDDRK